MQVKEDINVQSPDAENGYLVSQGPNDETYVLGQSQKQMLLDADSRDPYNTFHYYFLSYSSVSADREVLEGTIDDEWRVNFYNGKIEIDCGDIKYENVIGDRHLLDEMLESMRVTEDIEPDTDNVNPYAELANIIAEKMGDCKVVDNVVYYLNHDFEIWDDLTLDDSDWKDVEYGIFSIIEVKPNIINVYTPTASTCEEVDSIGVKPLEYFAGTIQFTAKSIKEFINKIDLDYGREWFDDYDAEQEFADTYEPLLTGEHNEE